MWPLIVAQIICMGGDVDYYLDTSQPIIESQTRPGTLFVFVGSNCPGRVVRWQGLFPPAMFLSQAEYDGYVADYWATGAIPPSGQAYGSLKRFWGNLYWEWGYTGVPLSAWPAPFSWIHPPHDISAVMFDTKKRPRWGSRKSYPFYMPPPWPVDFGFEEIQTLGMVHCTPLNPNSTGRTGKAFVTAEALVAYDIPRGEAGLWIMSDVLTPPTPMHVGSGTLCLGGHIDRLQPFVSVTETVKQQAGVSFPGTWGFQAWYTDGLDSNTTEAVAVTY
jgi:hypothetical protein